MDGLKAVPFRRIKGNPYDALHLTLPSECVSLKWLVLGIVSSPL